VYYIRSDAGVVDCRSVQALCQQLGKLPPQRLSDMFDSDVVILMLQQKQQKSKTNIIEQMYNYVNGKSS
jgi:hypothetical protein